MSNAEETINRDGVAAGREVRERFGGADVVTVPSRTGHRNRRRRPARKPGHAQGQASAARAARIVATAGREQGEQKGDDTSGPFYWKSGAHGPSFRPSGESINKFYLLLMIAIKG